MAKKRIRSLCVATACGLALAAGSAAASEGGLVLLPDPLLLVALVVGFAVLVPVVNRVLLAPLLKVLDARIERTQGSRRRAARIEDAVRESIERYERAISEGRQRAETDRRSVLEEARRRAAEETGSARADAELEIGRARSELVEAVAEARRGLRDQSTSLAREVASSVLGRELA